MYKKILCLIFLCVNFAFFAMEKGENKGKEMGKAVLALIFSFKSGNAGISNISRSIRQLQGLRQKKFASQKIIESCDTDGDTLLHASAMCGNPALFSMVMQLSINENITNNNGQMPVDVLQAFDDDNHKLCLKFYAQYQDCLKK